MLSSVFMCRLVTNNPIPLLLLLLLFLPRTLLPQVDAAAMDADDGTAAANGSAAADSAASTPLPAPSSLPEVELYAYLLTLMILIDNKQYEQVGGWVGGWATQRGGQEGSCWLQAAWSLLS